MSFGFAPQPPTPTATGPVSRHHRTLRPEEWPAAGTPLLRDARATVTALHERHRPRPWTMVVAVLGPGERLVASASFAPQTAHPDGWEFRNALLGGLRRVLPHDLRRKVPVRTAVLLCCRPGEPGWTAQDGAWMWGLRDASTLHGLRCGAYITLTAAGWRVLGEGRSGRRPTALTATAPSTATPPATTATTGALPASVTAIGPSGSGAPFVTGDDDCPRGCPAAAGCGRRAPRGTGQGAQVREAAGGRAVRVSGAGA